MLKNHNGENKNLKFYQEENYVLSQKKQGEKIEVPKNILDMVSLFYSIRNHDYKNFKYDQLIKIVTYFDDEIFPFDIRYRGIETIRTPLGKFECLKFVPFVEPGRIFESEDDMTIWISNDKNLIPLRIQFDLIVGSFKCDLIKYKNLKFPLLEVK